MVIVWDVQQVLTSWYLLVHVWLNAVPTSTKMLLLIFVEIVIVVVRSVMDNTHRTVPSARQQGHRTICTWKCVFPLALMAFMLTQLQKHVRFVLLGWIVWLVSTMGGMWDVLHVLMVITCTLITLVRLHAISMSSRINGIIVVIHVMLIVVIVPVPTQHHASIVELLTISLKILQVDIVWANVQLKAILSVEIHVLNVIKPVSNAVELPFLIVFPVELVFTWRTVSVAMFVVLAPSQIILI